MLKIRIGRKRKDRAPREDYFAAAVRATIAPEPVAEASDIIGYNKAGRAYDKRTGRLIKSADLTSHEI